MAKNLNWLKLTVHHPPIAAEALSGLLFDAGAQGVWEDLPDPLGRLVSRAGFEPSESEKLGRLMPAIIANLSESFELDQGTFEFSLELEERHDWAEKWKEGLKPVLVTSNLALAPTWLLSGSRYIMAMATLPLLQAVAARKAWPHALSLSLQFGLQIILFWAYGIARIIL